MTSILPLTDERRRQLVCAGERWEARHTIQKDSGWWQHKYEYIFIISYFKWSTLNITIRGPTKWLIDTSKRWCVILFLWQFSDNAWITFHYRVQLQRPQKRAHGLHPLRVAAAKAFRECRPFHRGAKNSFLRRRRARVKPLFDAWQAGWAIY